MRLIGKIVVILLVCAGITACSGNQKPKVNPQDAAAAQAADVAKLEAQLAAMAQKIDELSGVRQNGLLPSCIDPAFVGNVPRERWKNLTPYRTLWFLFSGNNQKDPNAWACELWLNPYQEVMGPDITAMLDKVTGESKWKIGGIVAKKVTSQDHRTVEVSFADPIVFINVPATGTFGSCANSCKGGY